LLRQALLGSLAELKGKTARQLIDDRYEKFRKMGNFFSE